VQLLQLIDGADARPHASDGDNAPVIDRNLVTVFQASEDLVELEALNDVLALAATETRAA
jgi:hypothetical protein